MSIGLRLDEEEKRLPVASLKREETSVSSEWLRCVKHQQANQTTSPTPSSSTPRRQEGSCIGPSTGDFCFVACGRRGRHKKEREAALPRASPHEAISPRHRSSGSARPSIASAVEAESLLRSHWPRARAAAPKQPRPPSLLRGGREERQSQQNPSCLPHMRLSCERAGLASPNDYKQRPCNDEERRKKKMRREMRSCPTWPLGSARRHRNAVSEPGKSGCACSGGYATTRSVLRSTLMTDRRSPSNERHWQRSQHRRQQKPKRNINLASSRNQRQHSSASSPPRAMPTEKR